MERGVKFYFDENLSPRFARVLTEVYHQSSHQLIPTTSDARFPRGTKDFEIISRLAAEAPKPVFLTADVNMHTKYPTERQALVDSRLTVFFFKKGFQVLPFPDQVQKLIATWPKVVYHAERCRTGAFEVNPNGKVIPIQL